MVTGRSFDVIVVGGGIAGSTLAGVLARSGLGVLVVEKEARFRDRVRGEATLPWGLADALPWDSVTCSRRPDAWICGDPALRRPAPKHARRLRDGLDRRTARDRLPSAAPGSRAHVGGGPGRHGGPTREGRRRRARRGTVRHVSSGRSGVGYQARLIVGADGKLSMARRWFGAETISDPEVNRFGGVLVSGVRTDDRDTDNVGDSGDISVNWFAQSADMTRLYLMGPAEVLREQASTGPSTR